MGGHRVNYKVAKATSASHKRSELDKNKIMDEFATIATDKITENPRAANTCVRGATLISTTLCSTAASESANMSDGQKIKSGSSIRKKYINLEKV